MTKHHGLDCDIIQGLTTSLMLTEDVTARLQNSDLYMDGVDVIKGDVYQYSTLPPAMHKW